MSKSILVVCLSDSHGLHRDVSVPPGDVGLVGVTDQLAHAPAVVEFHKD